MNAYTRPPLISAGQILGRATVGIYRDNDDYFNGLANRSRPIPAGVFVDWPAGGWNLIAWDGWHLLAADAKTMHYYFTVTSVDAGSYPITATLYYDYGGPSQTVIATATGNQTASGSYSLSSFAAGFYRVTCRLTKTDDNYGGTLTFRAPFTVYTGSEAYTAGYTITDGNVSSEAHFNRWRDNDIYFNAISPRQVAFAGMEREYPGTELTITLFDGWDKFHPDHYKLGYQVYLEHTGSNNHLHIWYDYDNVVLKQGVTINIAGTTASTWNLLSPGNYTKGNYYRVRVELQRDSSSGGNCKGRVDFLYMNPAVNPTGYTVMDPFTVNQWVYGSTAGQLTRLDYLTDNDASIYDRLAWADTNTERLDYACFKPVEPIWGDTGNYYLVHRKNLLYYRASGATLHIVGGGTQGLSDYDDDNPYRVLDLNSIDLPYGSYYRIEGNLEFAQEQNG